MNKNEIKELIKEELDLVGVDTDALTILFSGLMIDMLKEVQRGVEKQSMADFLIEEQIKGLQ